MKSILEMYKIGMGPSDAINMGTYRACREICDSLKNSLQTVHHVDVCMYNEYRRVFKESGVEKDIRAGFEGASFPINIITDGPTPPAARADYTFDIIIYASEKEAIARHRIISTGGGNYFITDRKQKDTYQFQNFKEIQDFFNSHKNMTYMDFACLFEKKEDIINHFKVCIRVMDVIIDRGIKATGPLDLKNKDLFYERRASYIYNNKPENETDEQEMNRLISAYAYAIGEENAQKCVIVGIPTASPAATLWGALRYIREKYKPTDEQIYEGLAGAGLLGSLVEKNTTFGIGEAGCQGLMACGCGMTAILIATILYNADINECGRALEMAIEHTLGLICNSVCVIPLIPCIQRAAAFAIRAYEIAILNHSLMQGDELVKVDDVITTLKETCIDLLLKNRQIASYERGKYAVTKEGKKE